MRSKALFGVMFVFMVSSGIMVQVYATYEALPEFPPRVVLPLLIALTIIAVLYMKRKELSGTTLK